VVLLKDIDVSKKLPLSSGFKCIYIYQEEHVMTQLNIYTQENLRSCLEDKEADGRITLKE
jgi:hypothetical protein